MNISFPLLGSDSPATTQVQLPAWLLRCSGLWVSSPQVKWLFPHTPWQVPKDAPDTKATLRAQTAIGRTVGPSPAMFLHSVLQGQAWQQARELVCNPFGCQGKANKSHSETPSCSHQTSENHTTACVQRTPWTAPGSGNRHGHLESPLAISIKAKHAYAGTWKSHHDTQPPDLHVYIQARCSRSSPTVHQQ